MYQVVDEAPAPKVVEEEPIVVRKPVVVSIQTLGVTKKYNNSITSITCDLTGPIELDPNYVLL